MQPACNCNLFLLCHFFLFILYSYVGKLLFTAGLNLNDLLLLQFLLLNSTRLDLYDLIKNKKRDKNEISDFYDFINDLNGDKKCEFNGGKE